MNKSTIFIIPAILCTFLFLMSCNQKSGSEQKSVQTVKADEHAGHDHAHHTASASDQQLCDAHKAPKNLCFICDASLRDPKRLWCNEHSRYEDRCFICHPEIKDSSRLYCSEHGLYEDECILCHPEITKG